jgi:microsomal dipeptidase-like Zn-dependent dipeptidase
MSARRRMRSLLVATFIATGIGVWSVATPAEAAPIDVYAFANGCYTLQDASSGRWVGRDLLGFHAGATTAAAATPFRMQATALGRYLFYGTGGQMMSVGLLNSVPATTSPGVNADWAVADGGNGRLRITSVANGKGLGVGLFRRLGQTPVAEARWALQPAQGCASFPEIAVNATGAPLRTTSPDAPVRGFLDAHTHVSGFQFLGGKFHCGRPWSPYGVTVALRDCVDHGLYGETAIFENFLSTGNPIGTHSTDGWPSFAGWPRHDSLTHESTYWKWIERAWRGGLRIMVNDLVENRALCEIYPLKQNDCNEMNSARRQAQDMFALQDYIDAQFGGPGKGFFRIVRSPSEARQVIHEGKLAVILGVEVSEVLDCGQRLDVPVCTTAQIDQQMNDLWALGVRSFFPVHKFDNALGGTHFDDGATGLLVNVGNFYATGQWWRAERCAPGAEPDHSPTSLSGNTELLYLLLGQTLGDQLLGTTLPAYPPAPVCNPRGLTPLGAHVINRMIEMGFIIETDHMSVKARNEALTIIEASDYSGLITSHSWGDASSQQRLQALGGVVAPYARDATVYVDSWHAARAGQAPEFLTGYGYGSDNNGLGAQPAPRAGNAANPVAYPYDTFDGGTVMDRQVSGTRTYDVNVDGVAHYGLFPDYIEDLRMIAGDQIVDDLANGAEAYLQMWERALG